MKMLDPETGERINAKRVQYYPQMEKGLVMNVDVYDKNCVLRRYTVRRVPIPGLSIYYSECDETKHVGEWVNLIVKTVII